jgi:hypothetical protein
MPILYVHNELLNSCMAARLSAGLLTGWPAALRAHRGCDSAKATGFISRSSPEALEGQDEEGGATGHVSKTRAEGRTGQQEE